MCVVCNHRSLTFDCGFGHTNLKTTFCRSTTAIRASKYLGRLRGGGPRYSGRGRTWRWPPRASGCRGGARLGRTRSFSRAASPFFGTRRGRGGTTTSGTSAVPRASSPSSPRANIFRVSVAWDTSVPFTLAYYIYLI